MRHLTSLILATACAGSLLAGCGGGQAGAQPGLPAVPAAHGNGTASFVIAVPKPPTSTTTARAGTRPQYVSPATQSITVALSGPTPYTATANLTVGSSGCTSTLASTTCTLTVPGLAPGSYTATLTTYDVTGGTGKVLSAAQSIAFTVLAGQSNTVSLTLSGVPASTVVAPGSLVEAATGSNSYNLLGQGARAFLVESLDADGNIIVGSGAPTFTLSAPSGALSGVTLTAPTASAPNRFSVTPPTAYASGKASFTVTPTFTGQATNGCLQPGANCTAVTVTVAMASILYVVNNANNIVTAYDLNGVQQTLSGTFPGLNSPDDIAFDSSTGFLYVVNGNSTVTAYDGSGTRQTLSSTFPNTNSPVAIAYDPSTGFLYVTNYGNSTVTAYSGSGAQQTLSGTFPNTNKPDDIAYDPSNGFLYVANNGNNTVTAYNASGTQQMLSGTFPNLNGPFGIAYDPSNGFLYLTNLNNTVTAYDASGAQQTLSGTFPNTNRPVDIEYDPSTGFLYISNSSNHTVTAYNASGAQQTLSGTFPNLNGPDGMAIVP